MSSAATEELGAGLAGAADGAARHGLLLLDKPLGISSNGALQRVRRLAGGIKAGHCGSLDPLASGMLPICLGEATRLAGLLLQGRKAYRFEVRLGERSASGDAEGPIVERCTVPALTRADIEPVLGGFLGAQSQIPPMYSALKRQGQPLYRLARQGVSVEREARAIHIEALQLLELQSERLELRVICSAGTYVRVLGEDLAGALGTCGRLESLRREYVAPFEADAMVSLPQLEAALAESRPWPVLPADRAVGHLPALQLDRDDAHALSCGRTLPWPQSPGPTLEGGAGQPEGPPLWRLYDAQRRFLGLGTRDTQGRLAVQRLFSQPLVV